MNTLLGSKVGQTQKFLENGTRIPVSIINVAGNAVVGIKTKEKHGYTSIQLGFGAKKKPNKALQGITKGAKLTIAPRFFKEARVGDLAQGEIGSILKASEIFKAGDIIKVTGISKGKGYAGVVKRHHFKGGPRTHGQSDRERAPGSIGQTTTPGRVYKGKRMAGRMGHVVATIRNLQIVAVTDEELLIKGLIPGIIGNVVSIEKIGEAKKFVPLYREEVSKAEEVSNVSKGEAEEKPQTEVQVEAPQEEAPAGAQEEIKDQKSNVNI